MIQYLANPQALWLLSVIPLVIGLGWWANRRRRRDLARLASVPALAFLLTLSPARRRGRQTFLLLALLLVIVAIAGPRWGKEAEQAVTQGRDLIVVLDLSRSMLAEQPSRQELARRALNDLADSLEKRGGHRIGLVVFAAQPKLVMPLTHDYDHFRESLARQDAAALPPELRPRGEDMTSGTRIGAALKLAVAAFDLATAGYQDILLVSDGDDPAGDEEWALGAEDARQKGVAVFTLGLGDADNRSPIPSLEFEGKPVLTRLEEKPLEDIAKRTQGAYLAAHRQPLPEGALYRAVLDSQRSNQTGLAALPALRPQYRWFFGAALLFLALSLLLGDKRRMGAMLSRPFSTEGHEEDKQGPRKHVGLQSTMLSRPVEPNPGFRSTKAAKAWHPAFTAMGAMLSRPFSTEGHEEDKQGPPKHVGSQSTMLSRPVEPNPGFRSTKAAKAWHPAFTAMFALLLISAAPQVRDPETLIREGTAAFAQGNFDAALAAFEQAEERTADPGLVAFNKAATLFRLERFREAELGYVRCLEDKEVPAARRVRAWHDLGTTLMHLADGKDKDLLGRAVSCFVSCLKDDALDAELAASAEFNLELARLQWLKAEAKKPHQGEDNKQANGQDKGNPNPPETKDPWNDGPRNAKEKGKKGTAGKANPTKDGKNAVETPETTPGGGNLPTLADSDVLQPLDDDDAIAHLERAARRIELDQRAQWQVAPRVAPNVKDW